MAFVFCFFASPTLLEQLELGWIRAYGDTDADCKSLLSGLNVIWIVLLFTVAAGFKAVFIQRLSAAAAEASSSSRLMYGGVVDRLF